MEGSPQNRQRCERQREHKTLVQYASWELLKPACRFPAKLETETAMSRIQELSLTPTDHALLAAVANEVSSEESRQFRRLLPAVAAEARAVAGHWDFMSPANVVDRLIDDTRAFPNGAEGRNRTRLRQAAVARLALGFFRPDDRLTSSILKLYPAFFGRLASFLHDRADGVYDGDFFAKDVRYALGLTIPCGALQFDLNGVVGPKLIARDLLATRSLRSTAGYLAARGWGRWYSNHIDVRAIKEFTPDGWTASFARIAELLALNPAVRGVAGVAWFYDPELARVSPHLSYIGQTLQRSGAFRVAMKTQEHDIANALARSLTRKKLHARGEYSPACYLVAWPRRALLEWAARLKIDPSVSFGSCASADERGSAHPIGLVTAAPASP
jgi:hypothetical protein